MLCDNPQSSVCQLDRSSHFSSQFGRQESGGVSFPSSQHCNHTGCCLFLSQAIDLLSPILSALAGSNSPRQPQPCSCRVTPGHSACKAKSSPQTGALNHFPVPVVLKRASQEINGMRAGVLWRAARSWTVTQRCNLQMHFQATERRRRNCGISCTVSFSGAGRGERGQAGANFSPLPAPPPPLPSLPLTGTEEKPAQLAIRAKPPLSSVINDDKTVLLWGSIRVSLPSGWMDLH